MSQSLPAENNDVQAGQILLNPESFSDLAFYPIALDSQSEILFGKYESDPGMTQVIGCCQDQKIPVRNFQLHIIEDFAVVRRPQQSVRLRKRQSLHEAIIRLRRQTCAAFGTTTGNNLTAVRSSHTGTEAVNTLALQDAWLKCSFHGEGLTNRLWTWITGWKIDS